MYASTKIFMFFNKFHLYYLSKNYSHRLLSCEISKFPLSASLPTTFTNTHTHTKEKNFLLLCFFVQIYFNRAPCISSQNFFFSYKYFFFFIHVVVDFCFRFRFFFLFITMRLTIFFFLA